MPANYPDLSTIFDQLGPMAGASAVGERQALGNSASQADIGLTQQQVLEHALENQYNTQNMPTRLSASQANLAQTIALTQGTQATTQGQNLNNSVNSQTLNSNVAAKNSANGAAVDENTAKGMSAVGAFMGQFGQELQGVPPMQIPTVMAAFEQANPGIKNSPSWNKAKQLPPEQAAQFLQQAAQKINANSSTNQSEMMKLAAQNQNQLQQIGAQGANQRDLQQMMIDAGKYNRSQGKTTDILINAIKNPADRQAALNDAAEVARQQGDQQGYLDYTSRAQVLDNAAKVARSNAGAQNVSAGDNGLTSESRGSAVPSGMPSLGPNGPTQSAPQAASLSSVQAQYPGIPADVLRAKYKAKFGVDLQ